MRWGLRAGPPSIDDRRQIVHTDDSVAINIRIRIITAPSLKNSKQVMDGNKAVAADVRAVRRAHIGNSVATVVDPAAIDLIRIVPAHHRIRQRGAAVVSAADPAAVAEVTAAAGGVV